MSKSKLLLIFVPIFAIILLTGLYYREQATKNSAAIKSENEMSLIVDDGFTASDEALGDEGIVAETGSTIPDVNLDTGSNDLLYLDYSVGEGSTVSYRVMKQYFSKPVEEVIGSGDGIEGVGSLSRDGKFIKLNARIDISSVKTNSSKRDTDVLKLFSSNLAKISVDTELTTPLNPGSQFSIEVPSKFTLNNTSRDVTFVVNGSYDTNTVNARGSTKVKLSDYGIDAPNLAGVFSVSDEITFEFNIVGVRSN